MKILLITQWYKPIRGAVRRMTQMAESLSEEGHEVTVLTGFPSYPTGILPSKYQWKLWVQEKDKKITIIRTYEYPTPNKGVFRRIFNNFSFLISASIAILLLPKHQAVIVSSPPFISGAIGLLATRIWKSDFYFDVRDLWPDSAIALDLLKNNFFIRILKWLEILYYKKAIKIFTATPDIADDIIAQGIAKTKTVILLNSIDTKIFCPKKVNRKLYGFTNDDFIVCYIGNHGQAQDLAKTISAIKYLKKYQNIKFLFVGEGEQKEKLIKISRNLKNIIFWSERSQAEIINIINLSDVGIISLASNPIFQHAIPSKSLEYFACAKPVVASVSGTLADFIMRYQSGFVYNPKDSQSLSKVILKLYANPLLVQKMGKNSRNLASQIFSRQIFRQIFTTVFQKT